MRMSFAIRPPVVSLLMLWTATAGCSGRPGRVAAPDVDADAAAELAMNEYDRNSDGQLDADELKASPPLVAALPTYDGDGSGSLSQAEIAAGIKLWSERGVGAMALPFTVRLDGRPLEGADVKLIPAAFLGDAVMPASGMADSTGSGSLAIREEDKPSNVPRNLPVVQPGLYSVEITHPSRSVPAKFNTSTTLGLETSVAGQNPAGVLWSLTSK
jgi:hypothetical protein